MYLRKSSGFLLWDACASLLLITVAISLLFVNIAQLQKQKNYLQQQVQNYQTLENLSKKALLEKDHQTVTEVTYHDITIYQKK